MAGASLLLAGCNHDAFVNSTPFRIGEWGIDPQTDRVTGVPISNSLLVTNRVSHGGILFPPPARLQLLCSKEHAAVNFAFEFKIGSTRNAEVAYRFDDKPRHEPRARIVNGYLSVLIDDPYEVKQFVGEMATSDVLYLRIRSLTATGRTSAEFKVAGAAPAIAADYASCPLTAVARTSAMSPRAVRDDKEEKDDKKD
jgi:hypothetical protein